MKLIGSFTYGVCNRQGKNKVKGIALEFPIPIAFISQFFIFLLLFFIFFEYEI